MPERQLASSDLDPGGGTLLTPALGDPARFSHRVVLEGVLNYSGGQFDALYKRGADGIFRERHSYLRWTPAEPVLESADAVHHRYVFRIPAEWKLEGGSAGVQIAIDRIVDEFLITPSEA